MGTSLGLQTIGNADAVRNRFNAYNQDQASTAEELQVAWPTDELEGEQLGGQHGIANDSGWVVIPKEKAPAKRTRGSDDGGGGDEGGGDEGNTNCPSNNHTSILIIYVLLQSIIPRGKP